MISRYLPKALTWLATPRRSKTALPPRKERKTRSGGRGGKRYPLDGLFLAIGTAGAADFARTLGVITEGDTIVTDGCATNLPGLFAAGDCTRGLKQIAKAVSDGANAAMAAIAYLRGT